MAVASAPRTAPRRSPADEPRVLAGLMEVAERIVAELLAGSATREDVSEGVACAAFDADVGVEAARRDVYALAVRDLRLLAIDPTAAIDVHLGALLVFGPIAHASLWKTGAKGHELVATAGARVGREVARRALRGTPGGDDPALHVVPVLRLGASWGAIVVQADPGAARRALEYAGEAADALAPVVERHFLLGGLTEAAEQLLQAADRRSARMAYDLHDGPLQDLTLLVGRLSFLPRQLNGAVGEELRGKLEQNLGDVKAIAMEIANDLRELAITAGGGASVALGDTLQQELSHFRRRSSVRASLVVEGDVERTTPSQRIAVARVVEEALANVREHSCASEVRVVVEREDGLLRVAVVDDGRGFDVARARKRAARDRRLGLLGMSERVSLLGGRFEVDSRPGGPTVVSAVLPAWSPAASIV